jgi:hypothetical protein
MEEIDTVVRGFFWGNILSSGHIAALGGLDAVMANAPVASAVDLSTGQHERVYLQLSDDLFDVTDEAEEQLREYFAPVLPVAAPRESDSTRSKSRRKRTAAAPSPVLERTHTSPDVVMTAVFGQPPDDSFRTAIERLLDAWYLLGTRGGFGSWLHNVGPITFTGAAAEWTCDLGDTDDLALDVLTRSLLATAEECRKAVVGFRITDQGTQAFEPADDNA